MNLKKLLSYQYLFEINRVGLDTFDKTFLIIGIVALVIALGVTIKRFISKTPHQKRIYGKLSLIFWYVAIAELLWYAARYEFVTLFGSHFVALLLLLIGVVWFVVVIKNHLKGYRAEKMAWEKEQLKAKYLQR